MQLNFSYNWNNKLHCKAFTTIRIYQPAKYKPNTPVEIYLNKTHIANGVILAVKPFYLKDLNEYVAYIDTGYPVEHCATVLRKMYPDFDFEKGLLSLILVTKVEKEKIWITK